MKKKKHWYIVSLTRSKYVRVFAENQNDAESKAESQNNIRNSLWVADGAYREDGQPDNVVGYF
jgi:hypothetical protein